MIYGIKHRKIKRYIKDFKGLDYRLSKVNEYIYNDSKSTNPYSKIPKQDNWLLTSFAIAKNIPNTIDKTKTNLDKVLLNIDFNSTPKRLIIIFHNSLIFIT